MLRFIKTGLVALNLVLNCVLAMALGVRLVAEEMEEKERKRDFESCCS